MNAIKQIRKCLEEDPKREFSKTQARLAAAFADESDFPLVEPYRLD